MNRLLEAILEGLHLRSHHEGEIPCYVREMWEKGELLVIRLKGAIDAKTIPAIEADSFKDMHRYLDKNILLDFETVTHVDTATVASLVFLLGLLQKHHRNLAIVNASDTLEHYIDIERVDKIVHEYDDENVAVRELM